jgi:hypothetical protein
MGFMGGVAFAVFAGYLISKYTSDQSNFSPKCLIWTSSLVAGVLER